MTLLDPNACRYRVVPDRTKLPEWERPGHRAHLESAVDVWRGECGQIFTQGSGEETPKGACPRCGLQVMFERFAERRHVGFVIKPCECGAGGGPHYHVDAHTIVPWPEFERAMKEYAAKRS